MPGKKQHGTAAKPAVSRTTIHRYRRQGLDVGPMGQPDAAAVAAIHAAKQESGKFGSSRSETAHLWDERYRKAKALDAEMLLAKQLGKLIERSVVEEQWYRGIRKIRDGLLNLPDRTAGLVAAVTKESQAKVHAIMTKELHAVLEELSRLTLKGKA
jgi:hypothetical protein